MTDAEKKERIRAQRQASYQRNRDKVLEKARTQYAENSEKLKQKEKERRQNDPERAREVARKSRQKNLDRVREESKRYRESHREFMRDSVKAWYYQSLQRRLFDNAKHRANTKGIPFDITIDDIVVPDVCPVFGVPFVWGDGINDYSPSLDKVIPKLGYVKGNIQVICTLANRIKSNATAEQVEKVLQYLLRFLT